LKGPNGRFKNIRISDIILPRLPNEWLKSHTSTDTTVDSEIKENTTEYVGTEKKSEMLNVLDLLPVMWKKECKHTVIVGAVGMGKTVSLIHWWEKYLENREETKPVPVFIELNEFNQIKEVKRDGFILSMIYEHYGNTSTITREDIWEAMKRPMQQGEYIPSMVLLLDGFNEMTVEKRELLLELNRIVEQCPGVQVIITSRYDMRADLNWNDWSLVLLLKLKHGQIEKYLTEMGMRIPELDRVLKVLKNPMMLKLYRSECKAQELPKNLDPASKASVLWDIAELHLAEKDFAKAFSCAREAFSMDNQQDREVIYKLGIYAAWGGDTDTALSSINRSIEIYRTNSNIVDDEHNWEITKKDISKSLRFLTADDNSIEQQAIDDVEKMAADVEQLEDARNHNFLVETKDQLLCAYEKMKNPSYCTSSAWILNMFQLKEIISWLKDLPSLYKKNDAKKKEHSKLNQSRQSIKPYKNKLLNILGKLFLMSYLITIVFFAFAFDEKVPENYIISYPVEIIKLIVLWIYKVILWPIYVILKLLAIRLLDLGDIKDLMGTPFIMAYVSIFLFLLIVVDFIIGIFRGVAEEKEKEKSNLERKIMNTERELNNIKDEIKKGELRIKMQLSDIIGE
jgi:hypothetical protein